MPQQHVRRRTAPIHPRRVSGPARPRLATAAAGVALPPRTGVFERIRALPDKRVVDRLLRGRLCIWVIGILLGGIVAMQVSLLRLNAGISRAVITAQTLERQNSDLEALNSKSIAGDRVRRAAAETGMIDPPAGDTPFLTAHPDSDAARAVERMKPPSDAAITVMNNGGRAPSATATVTPPAAGLAASTPVATPTPTPPAAVQSAVQPAATPVPTVTPVQTPPPATGGGATAPQG